MLDQYYASYFPAYETVFRTIRDELGLEPSGRKKKTTQSIREKLRRESMRLSQMQDIAGCRIIVEDVVAQDAAVRRLSDLFNETIVVDRREHPSHGYRAVHVLVYANARTVEVQIRTIPQHVWAQLSEILADRVGIDLKYGGGPKDLKEILNGLSSRISDIEELERQTAEILLELRRIPETMTRTFGALAWRCTRPLLNGILRLRRLPTITQLETKATSTLEMLTDQKHAIINDIESAVLRLETKKLNGE